MARQRVVSPNGSDDPRKATWPCRLADGALQAGHEAAIILLGDAVVVMNDAVVDSIQGVGLPPLKDLVAKAIENKVPIYV